MAQSPQRSRKAQPQQGQLSQAPQESSRREKSPTGTIRERQPQRSSYNAQSIPPVPPMNAQMMERQYQDGPRQPAFEHTRQSSFDNGHEGSPERRSLPPPPQHTQSTQAVPQTQHQAPPQPVHSHSQPVVPVTHSDPSYAPTHHNPRPMNPIPQNLLTRNWQEQAALVDRENSQDNHQSPQESPREPARQSTQEPPRQSVQDQRLSLQEPPRQSLVIPTRPAIPYDESHTYPEGHGGVAYAGALSRGNSMNSVNSGNSLSRGNSMNAPAGRGQPASMSPKQTSASSPKERVRPNPKESSPIQPHSSPRESPKARQPSSPNVNGSFPQQQIENRYGPEDGRNYPQEDNRYGREDPSPPPPRNSHQADDGRYSNSTNNYANTADAAYPPDRRNSQTPEPHQIPLPSPVINYGAQYKYPPRVPSPLSGRRPSITDAPARVSSPLAGRRNTTSNTQDMRSINQELRSYNQDMSARPIANPEVRSSRLSTQLHSQVHTPPLQMMNTRPVDTRTPEGPPARLPETQSRTPEASYPNNRHTPEVVKARTTPDRSLPVQEELDDETHHIVGYHAGFDRPEMPSKRNSNSYRKEPPRVEDFPKRMPSPTPSSDLNPEGQYGGRESRAGHREEDDSQTLIEAEEGGTRTRSSEEESFTPRSPSVNLPEDTRNDTIRMKARTGPAGQTAMRGIQASMFDPSPDLSRGLDNQSRQSGFSSVYEQQDQVQRLHEQYEAYMRYSREFGGPESNRNSVNPDELQAIMDGAPGLYEYLQSPRPNAPIPPTPLSETAAPSPAPSFPAPVGSPYPYPFNHVLRGAQYSSQPQAYEQNTTTSASYEAMNNPAAIQQQLAQQLHMYALNNNPAPSDSTFSPSSTPFQAAALNPWAFLAANKMFGGIPADLHSMQSSPSHEPLPPAATNRGRNLKRRDRSTNLKNTILPPPRVESTQPRETSPEPSSSGEETAGEEHFESAEERQWVALVPEEEDDADWIDENEGDDGEDLMHLEYHPDFVSNVQKRGRRFESRWEALVTAFQAIDRQTDTTMVLLAAPSHSSKLHSLTSRSIRRDGGLLNSPAMHNMQSSFRKVATRRRVSRPPTLSLTDKLLGSSASSADSDGSSSREETLARALEGALGSLGALSKMYDQRETRWRAEMHRVVEDRERVSLLMGRATNGVEAKDIR